MLKYFFLLLYFSYCCYSKYFFYFLFLGHLWVFGLLLVPILFLPFCKHFILYIHTLINETLFHSSFLSLEVSPYSFSELLCAHGSCFDTLSFTIIDHFHDGIRALLGRALLRFISDLLLILSHRSFSFFHSSAPPLLFFDFLFSCSGFSILLLLWFLLDKFSFRHEEGKGGISPKLSVSPSKREPGYSSCLAGVGL